MRLVWHEIVTEERMGDICDLRQEVKELKKEVKELKKLIQVSNDKARGLAYAAVAKANMPIPAATSDKPDELKQQQRLRVEDDKCFITINTSRVKDEKSDFVAVKTKFQHAINDSGATGKAKIICLRQLPGERINVVFASAADAKRARNHTGSLGTAMLNAKVLSEPWYPIKCDMVAKRSVSDGQTPDGLLRS
jgi:hypothetical protein